MTFTENEIDSIKEALVLSIQMGKVEADSFKSLPIKQRLLDKIKRFQDVLDKISGK